MDTYKLAVAAAETIDLMEERQRDTHDGAEVEVIETAFVVRYRVDGNEDDEFIVYRAASSSALHTAQLLNDAANLALRTSR